MPRNQTCSAELADVSVGRVGLVTAGPAQRCAMGAKIPGRSSTSRAHHEEAANLHVAGGGD
jgi:hypothetical protein